MKYEEYIKKIDVLNEEFEEGLLLELHEKPPTNLHGEIMKSINRERKRANFLNYRIYAPAIAAVLVFAVAINRPEILEKLNFTSNVNITQKQNLGNNGDTDSRKNLKIKDNENPVTSKDTNVAINTSETPKTQGTVSDNINTNTTVNNSTAPQKNTGSNNKGNTTTQPNNTKDIEIASKDKVDTPPAEENNATDNKGNIERQLSIGNYLGLAFFKIPEVNYEIVLDVNRSTILNFITENNIEKLSTSNTYKLSLEQFDSLDKLLTKHNIGKKAISESVSDISKVVKIYLVNYQIEINKSVPNIMKFIEDQGKCIKIHNNTYKLTMENIDELDKILNSSGIKKDFISETDDEYTIIKTLITNYEVSIDASQTAVVSFLKDTNKCAPIHDNIYKMSRESLNRFKDLISNSAVEFKVLNETTNQDILIKVNNI